MQDDRLITVQDVYNVVAEHMSALDTLWPETDMHGPRKVHIVELIDGIKLGLVKRAEKNASLYESPFEKAAKKITGTARDIARPKPPTTAVVAEGKTAMQLAHEQAQSRMRR